MRNDTHPADCGGRKNKWNDDMAIDSNMMSLEVRSDLKKAWLAYLKSKGFLRAYAAARAQTPVGAVNMCRDMTSAESGMFGGLGNAYNSEVERISDLIVGKYAKDKGIDTDAAYKQLSRDAKTSAKLREAVSKSKEWKKFFKVFQQVVLKGLDTLAHKKTGDFYNTKFYKTWVRNRLAAEKIAHELELKRYSKDDLESLASSFVMDDKSAVKRVSAKLSKSGANMGTDEIIKKLDKKFGKLKL